MRKRLNLQLLSPARPLLNASHRFLSIRFMELPQYLNNEREHERITDLLALTPAVKTTLDVGCREGFIASKLAERGASVTAVDLQCPQIEGVTCVTGNATKLAFADRSFELVFCAEVLEHIADCNTAADEICRVASRYIVIAVPYKQDLTFYHSTCRNCGRSNPPWGHVNSFDERKLYSLFPAFRPVRISFVGSVETRCVPVASALMEMAGNPYGTYGQQEPCIHCGARLIPPARITLRQRTICKLAFIARRFAKPEIHPFWIHVLFERQ